MGLFNRLVMKSKFRESFSSELQRIINKAMQDNGFFLHPENVVVSLLGSTELDDRIIAFKRIQDVRSASLSKSRTFKIPSDLNFNAERLPEITSLQLEVEPALTREMSLEDLWKSVFDRSFSVPFECHSQVMICWDCFLKIQVLR